MKHYPFKRGDRVMTPDGRGSVVTYDFNDGIGRPGIVHDVYPDQSPKGMYTKNILYYFKQDFTGIHGATS